MVRFDAVVVDIVRDFLLVHRRMQGLFARFRDGHLQFEEVADLVGDDESSLLFRLKERCHAAVRLQGSESSASMHREELFDLAVGSLFHEAVKFRENLYQQERYAPRVRSLHDGLDREAAELVREFEKILSASALRLTEALAETEALLDHTRRQLHILLAHNREHGLLARFLCGHASLVASVYPEGLDALLAEIHGAACEGFMLAARSYLDSAYFVEARSVLDEVESRAPGHADASRLRSYADGMQAFLAGDYERSIAELARWIDAGPKPGERSHALLAQAAISRVGDLLRGAEHRPIVKAAESLAERIKSATPVLENAA